MNEFYNQKNKKSITRENIIGLGENSFQKNYYPELQEKILDLERLNVRYRSLIKTIPDILFVSDLEGHISPFTLNSKTMNPLILEILRKEDVIKQLREGIRDLIKTNRLKTSYFNFSFNETHYYFEARLHLSEIDEVLIIVRDVTEQVILEKQLREMAEKDSLTNLYNRRSFETMLTQFDKHDYEQLTILIIDIDGLKLVNDTLGHTVGDQIIISAAELIYKQFESIGYVARIGGDEFGVIITNMTQGDIEEQLEVLKASLEDYNCKQSELKLSLSSGYSYHNRGIVDTGLMFQESDNNMYQNKLLKEASTKNSLVKTLMKALEAKDYITEGHAERMDELATKMGEALKLSQSQIDRIQLLTKFHDIGKVGIPDTILKKPSSLTEDEWKVMKTHSSIGERIALASSELKEISHLILQHHERWDGSGYPMNIIGEEIPIECRILSIVDTFDAMTNDRPYRKALTIESAIEEIIKCSGTQFDPCLVELFQTIV